MIVSNEKKFIFVHNPKTAGTSMESALSAYGNAFNRSNYQKIRFLMTRKNILPSWKYRHYHKHMKAFEARRFFSDQEWNSLFKFGFVRNPYDRMVSLYLFAKRHTSTRSHDLVSKMDTFQKFADSLISEERFQENREIFQKTYFQDEGREKFIVDFIGRFENINEDFPKILETIGISVKLGWELRSDRKDYREYYDSRTRKLIESYCEPDLDEFKYTF